MSADSNGHGCMSMVITKYHWERALVFASVS